MIMDAFSIALEGVAKQRQESRRRQEKNAEMMDQLMYFLGGMENMQSAAPVGSSAPSGGVAKPNYGNTSLRAAEGSNAFQSFVRSIAQQESGGNYSARNPTSGAMGKYQIMPSNITGLGGWDKEALGYNITPRQFIRNRQLQDQIAQYKLREYFNKYGPTGAAQAWYGGPGSVGRNVSGGTGYPSSNSYAKQIRRRMRR